MLYLLLARTRIWHYFWMKEHFVLRATHEVFITANLFHKLATLVSSYSVLFPLFSTFSTFCCPSVSAVPSCFSRWLIITDWLLLSPEGGHTVQLTSRAPGTQALPYISPLLHQQRKTGGLALHLKRWASSCILIPKPLPLWRFSLSGWKLEGLWNLSKLGKTQRTTG